MVDPMECRWRHPSLRTIFQVSEYLLYLIRMPGFGYTEKDGCFHTCGITPKMDPYCWEMTLGWGHQIGKVASVDFKFSDIFRMMSAGTLWMFLAMAISTSQAT